MNSWELPWLQEDDLYEEDEDSNDEDNWRNDYPDEDPHFYENQDAEYYAGDGTAFSLLHKAWATKSILVVKFRMVSSHTWKIAHCFVWFPDGHDFDEAFGCEDADIWGLASQFQRGFYMGELQH